LERWQHIEMQASLTMDQSSGTVKTLSASRKAFTENLQASQDPSSSVSFPDATLRLLKGKDTEQISARALRTLTTWICIPGCHPKHNNRQLGSKFQAVIRNMGP